MTDNVFQLTTAYQPTGDQPQAIEALLEGLLKNKPVQVLLGATGTGKTFTIANVIQKAKRPVLVLVHNKTLAGQLYLEFKELFPQNRVEYFVSNFDFYQPEAYLPKSDTYINKNAVMNEEIEMLRTSAINSILERQDTIVVASVASIFGLSDPDEYRHLVFEIRTGETLDRRLLFSRLIAAQYARNSLELKPGTFRVRGDVIEIAPPNLSNTLIRIDTFGDVIEKIDQIDHLTGRVLKSFRTYPIFPAYDHAATHERITEAVKSIGEELKERLAFFKGAGRELEAERLELRTRQDMESMLEFGMCPGIENYARHIDGRKPGVKPFTLLDYFPADFLLVIDESHVTLPQVKGMYNGDRARKETLVEYGFRLPSALDNRPLNFTEFEAAMPLTICTSATPGDYELARAGRPVEQIIRPTGLVDPLIHVRPTLGQIDDLLTEIRKRIEVHERTMIVTLTIAMAEDLTEYLKERGFKVTYLHNETKTLERSEIIYQLRKGRYDVLVGINLLREGLDLPEVSLIIILDADKEGFLRSSRSLIQTIGRAARNKNGTVIMYADEMTESMKIAIDETNRRRAIQEAYNARYGIVPTTIVKEIRPPIKNTAITKITRPGVDHASSRTEIQREIARLTSEMKKAARIYDFERAAEARDLIIELRELLG